MNRIFAVLAVAALATPAAAQETQDTFRLREVVVSATRSPLERSAVAAAVSVVTGAELQQRGIRNVAEALRSITGTAVVQGGSYGAPASLFLRGGESDYVQVLIDGIQINSPGELFDFGNLTVENIERIEVVRGPVSVLYGSDAVTGVVQLFTRAGVRRGGVSAAASAGSFGSGALNAGLAGGNAALGYSIGVSHFRTDGTYDFNNEHDNTGITARLAYAASTATRLAGTLRYNTNTFHYPTDGAGNLVDANQFHVADAIAAGLDVNHALSSRLQLQAQLGFNRNDDNYDDAPDNAADTAGFYAFYSAERFQREVADVRLNYTMGARSIFTIGGELEKQRERGWNLSESEFGPFPGESRADRSNRAGYAQWIGALGSASLQAGARFEDNGQFGDFTTWRGGVALPLTSTLRVRAAAGTGFKEPRFYEQFATGFVKGNPDLQPETSRSLEAGIELTRGATRLGATAFGQKFRNLIQYIGMPAHQDDPNYLNLAGASANGLELEGEHNRGPLGVRASLSFFDTEVTDQGTGDDPLFQAGRKLVRRPDYTASLTASWRTRRFGLAATAHHVSDREDLDFSAWPAARVVLDSYTRIDVSANAPLGRTGLRGTLKMENLLDTAFEEVHNFPARGRAIFVGLSFGR